MDHMSDDFARALFSPEVEAMMIKNGDHNEAYFVHVLRGALVEAADAPGIPAYVRCKKLLDFDR